MIKRFVSYLICAILSLAPVYAQVQQTSGKVEMAEGLRSSGKIYVVVAVLITIFAGLVLYLIRLDRKITRLEKESDKYQRLP